MNRDDPDYELAQKRAREFAERLKRATAEIEEAHEAKHEQLVVATAAFDAAIANAASDQDVKEAHAAHARALRRASDEFLTAKTRIRKKHNVAEE